MKHIYKGVDTFFTFIGSYIKKIGYKNFFIRFSIIAIILLVGAGIIDKINEQKSFDESAAQIFATYEDNKIYDPEDYIQIGEKYFRADCSGYIDAVLSEMDIIDTNAASYAFMEDKDIKDTLTNAGFTYQILTDATDINSTGIVMKNGLVAIIIPNNEYDEFTLYCWGSKQATVKSLSAEQINKYGFTNIYSLNE